MMRQLILSLTSVLCLLSATVSAQRAVTTDTETYTGIGMNVHYVSYAGDMLYFNDLTRHGSHWLPTNETMRFTQDANGYPTSIDGEGSLLMLVVEEMRGLPNGDYLLTWEGTGRFTIEFNEQTWTFTEQDQSPQTLTVTDAQAINTVLLFLEHTDPDDHLRDLHLWLPGTSDATSPFAQSFKDRIAGFSPIRFTDWGITNTEVGAEDVVLWRTWDDRPRQSWYTWSSLGADGMRGVPYDLHIQLANEMQADMWISLPHLADDDFVAQLAQLIREQLDPELRVWVEYTNEHWNWWFNQALYVNEQAERVRAEEGYDEYFGSHYYARRAGETLAIFERVFAEDADRVIGVIAGQAGWAAPLQVALEEIDRMGTHDLFDVAAIAPYFGNSTDEGVLHPVDEAVASALPQIDAQDYDAIFTAIDAQITAMFTNQSETGREIQRNRELADRYDLPIVTYEAGQHYTVWGVESVDLDQEAMGAAYASVNRHPRMYDIYQRYLDLWYETYGGCTLVFFHLGGSWWWETEYFGHLEYGTQDVSDAHKYRAIRDWQAQNPQAGCRRTQ